MAFLSFFTLAVWKPNFFQHLATSRISVLLLLFQQLLCWGLWSQALCLVKYLKKHSADVGGSFSVQFPHLRYLCHRIQQAQQFQNRISVFFAQQGSVFFVGFSSLCCSLKSVQAENQSECGTQLISSPLFRNYSYMLCFPQSLKRIV